VAAAELRQAADAALLLPAESQFTAGFAPKRIADFTAGRLCARRALTDLGVAVEPIAINADRTPRWPSGVVGSITHTAGFCCAVVAKSSDVRAIGVDAELVGRVGPELDALVFTSEERRFLATLSDAARARATSMIFSAKEAFYKCQYGLTRRWLDFNDATIRLASGDVRHGSFEIVAAGERLATDADITLPMRGRFVIDGPLAITGVLIT
jgi:4'-phosphopantetheinyl transferase EntD